MTLKRFPICTVVLGLLFLLAPAVWAQTYSLGTTNLYEGPTAGSDSVVLWATNSWTATTNATWLHLSTGYQSGTVSTNVIFTFDANPGATRTGTLTIAGQTVTVKQAGSTYVDANLVAILGPSGTGTISPNDVALDGVGNVYFNDNFNPVSIKKWTATNNAFTTLVSSGLSTPRGVAMDSVGNLYFADSGNNTIKKWTVADSNVTTLVSSGISSPSSVAVDSAGNIFFSDTGNHAVKKWTSANSNVTTLYYSSLLFPNGVAVDFVGNVYFVDSWNNTIKKWTAASSNVMTLVSTGISSPRGVAVDGAGNVYTADGNTIKKWTAASNAVTTLLSSGLSQPSGVAVDGAGNVYIADTVNSAIKGIFHAFVDPVTQTEPAAGGSDSLPAVLPSTANFVGPLALTSDASWLAITGVTNGVVSFAITTNNFANRMAHILVLNKSMIVIQPGPPSYVSLGTSNLLVGATAGSDSVALAANSPWTATANDSWLHLSVANQSGTGSTNVIFTFDANAGATRTGTLTIAGKTVTINQAGSAYIPVTSATTLVSSNAITSLNTPYGVAVDGVGNVYFADTGNNAIKKWTVADNAVTTLVSSGLNGPRGVAVDGAGNIYIADTTNNAIKKWTAADSTVTTLLASNAITSLNRPYGVAVDVAGNVYCNSGVTIKKWTAVNSAVTTLVSAGLVFPWGVAVDGGGNVYIGSGGNAAVKKWIAASNTIATILSAGLNKPNGVAVDGSGNVYIADTGNNVIKELPHAFVDTTAKVEGALAGVDTLPAVFPSTIKLSDPFGPTNDSPWLTITGVTNSVVSYAFTANYTTNRTGYITLLGKNIAVTQPAVLPPVLNNCTLLGNGSLRFGFTNNQGATFSVWSATNMMLPFTNWTLLATLTNNGSGQYNFTNPPGDSSQRFYRVTAP